MSMLCSCTYILQLDINDTQHKHHCNGTGARHRCLTIDLWTLGFPIWGLQIWGQSKGDTFLVRVSVQARVLSWCASPSQQQYWMEKERERERERERESKWTWWEHYVASSSFSLTHRCIQLSRWWPILPPGRWPCLSWEYSSPSHDLQQKENKRVASFLWAWRRNHSGISPNLYPSLHS